MALPTALASLILLISVSGRPALARPQLVDDSQCGCFMTNGSNVAYYAEHRFYDFQSLLKYQGVPDPITDADGNAVAPATSDYFLSQDWNSTWGIQSWNNSASSLAAGTATVLMVNSPNNIYVEKNADSAPSSQTYLTMRTIRHSNFQSAAEIESVKTDYKFVSIRMLARTTGSPGAVTAMFTYRSASELAKIQEADLEIRTQDPRNTIQYTNQPSYTAGGDDIPQATQNVTLPNHLDWTDWAVHRLDWTPKQSTWYVDGVEVASITFQTPREPSQIILNAWSDGGDWSGNMTLHDQAYLQIQWLEMVFNSTGPVPGWTDSGDASKTRRDALLRDIIRRESGNSQCQSVCSIDDSNTTGVATMLWKSSASRIGSSKVNGSLVQLIPLAAAVALALPMFPLSQF
ncbi:Concanavalin A-like lectin/glucanase [Pleurostoma richardsiae]|uniref:Concanavalin A-like lectin/glucanase n=1 Tax=Pleurostoma richardsiae TaxID=41990 RepID=A0AA38VV63_9PEZI|nr:Concanavalin A-like lectin/glucanase [Pleurostoma richardsiae]